MDAETCSYEDDKRLWRQIYQHLLAENAALEEALDEMEVVLDKTNWTTDADIVISYVIKTIKRFKADSTPETPLLEMFDSEDGDSKIGDGGAWEPTITVSGGESGFYTISVGK